MSVTDELLANNARYAEQFSGELPLIPAKHLAVVTCMDARINVYAVLGLSEGEAHIIRNAGGVVTDDVVRSLVISQRFLGTTEIVLIHHTNCGMLTFTDEEFERSIEEETGIKPSWKAGAFSSSEEDLKRSITVLEENPFLLHTDSIRGFVFDISTGKLTEVSTKD